MKEEYIGLLLIIADGRIYSREVLAEALDTSETTIRKCITYLETLGLEIETIHGQSYRLPCPLELLSEKKIRRALPSVAAQYCKKIDILFDVDSTNSYLFKKLENSSIKGHVVLAEYQSDGRGRNGNRWISPLGAGFYLSIGWRFEKSPETRGVFSLYTAVAIMRALQSLGVEKISFKWPNDILLANKKLGGVLLEVREDRSGAIDIVVGIGINYDFPKRLLGNIDQRVTDVCQNTRQRVSRNEIVSALIFRLFEVFNSIQEKSSSILLDEWRKHDGYKNKKAKLILPKNEITGVLQGIDEHGSLLMLVEGQLQKYTAGEISLRVSE